MRGRASPTVSASGWKRTRRPWGNACAWFSLPLLLLLAACAARMPLTDRFGVVALTRGDRSPCVTFRTPASPSEHVQIILHPSQSLVRATLAEPIQECGFGQEDGFAYKLNADQRDEQLHGSIAVRGAIADSMTFRQCAGSETLHLTAWNHGRRIWKGIYYLGYDVEPDCGEKEID